LSWFGDFLRHLQPRNATDANVENLYIVDACPRSHGLQALQGRDDNDDDDK